MSEREKLIPRRLKPERKQPKERIYGGNPALTESYLEALRRAALSGVNVGVRFVYDPEEGLRPDMQELIERLRMGSVQVEVVPIPRYEWERGLTEGRDFVQFGDRYTLILPPFKENVADELLRPKLTLLSTHELDLHWPFLERQNRILKERAEKDLDRMAEKAKFLHGIVKGVFSNLDEVYKDNEWTTKKIVVIGADEEEERDTKIILVSALESHGVKVSTTEQDLKEADIIIGVTKHGSLKDVLSQPGMVKNGVMLVEVQLLQL